MNAVVCSNRFLLLGIKCCNLIKAIDSHPKIKFIGHPTGRIISHRDIPDDDWDKLFKICAEKNVGLEINGARLDLPVYLIKRAKSFGAKFVLNSDAHHVSHLNWQSYAIILARRAGLTRSDLITPVTGYSELVPLSF